MSRVRTLFLGTPDIARHVLEALSQDEHFEIVGVVSQPDRPTGRKLQLQPSPVKVLAMANGVPLLTPENINTDQAMDWVSQLKAEVAVVVAYGQILRQPFLDLFPQRVVNVHASILPHLRGAAPIQRSLMQGDPEGGVSLQILVRKMDAGPILGVRKFSQPADMTAADAYQECQRLAVELVTVDLMDYLRGNLSASPQDEAQVTFAPKIEKAEAEIDWVKSAHSIHNLIRGLALGPVAQTARNGKILKIHRTQVSIGASMQGAKPGEVIFVDDKSLIVQCGEGSLELLEVQPESRAKMPIVEYLRGYPMKLGDQFGRKS